MSHQNLITFLNRAAALWRQGKIQPAALGEVFDAPDLNDIGPKLAEALLQAAPFSSIDQIDAIPGIGPKRLAAMRAIIAATSLAALESKLTGQRGVAPRRATPVSSRSELEGRIIAKAWRDGAYRAQLLAAPKQVLAAELAAIDPSIKLPDKLEVEVHEESKDHYHLVIPRNPDDIRVSEVMSDEQLEAIAPQTIAVVVVGIGAVVANTMGAVNNIGAGNAVAAGNVAVTGNVAANFNAVG